jgi:hypothetical protein
VTAVFKSITGRFQSRRAVLAGLSACLVPVFVPGGASAQIRVPWFGQKTSSDCGRAILASLAARRGGNPQTYYDRLPAPTDARGYSIADMRRLAPRVGVSLSTTAPGGVVITGNCTMTPAVTRHMARIASAVRGGRPVVVPVGGGFGAGHYLILIGASASGFSALDPSSPGTRQYSTESLASSMCSYGFIALMA